MIREILQAKSDGKVIGLTASAWDLLHAGHCAMLSEAKTHCDVLVACIQTDPTIDRPDKNKPIQSVFERWVQVQAISEVDYVIPYATEAELIDILLTIHPDCRILGAEYRDTEFTGRDIEGITNIFNSRKHSFSSSSLRARVVEQSK